MYEFVANEGGLNSTIIIVAAIIVVGALGGIYLFTSSGSRSQATSQSTTISQTGTIYGNQTTTIFQNSSYQQSPNLPSCGSNYTLFPTLLFAPNSVISVVPLGSFIPPDHVFPAPHTYAYIANPNSNITKPSTYLYAPGNVVLTQLAIRNLKLTYGVYKNYTDYTLVFQPCKEFYLYFHNVASLAYRPFVNASQQLLKSCGKNQTYCSASVHIPISAGQIIGTIGNTTEGIQGIDVGARDYRLSTGRNAFVDPNRLCPLSPDGQPNVFDRCYDVCPYSYFSQNIQQQIHFSSPDGSIGAPGCGTVYQDVNGTAKGYWFPANGSTSQISPEATDMFMGQGNIQSQFDAFSIGVSVPGLPSGLYEFQPRTSGYVNRDFSNVTPSGVYCYQVNSTSGANYQITTGPPTVINVQLINKTTLLLQKQNANYCGNGPWSMGSNPAKFTR